jgi:predicted naringenin-chalcone synthase
MAETTYLASTDPIAFTSGAPHIAGTAVAFPPNRYNQEDVARELTTFADQGFMRFARTTGVDHRSLALPLSRYPKLTGFTEANTAYIEVAVNLGERAVLSALEAAGVAPNEVDIIVTVSSTGVAVPTIDARLAPAIGLRPDVKRVPLFGLGWSGRYCRDGACQRLSAGLPGARGGAAVGRTVLANTAAR